MKNVRVAYVNYNSASLIDHSMTSLPTGTEVIVVDNRSSDSASRELHHLIGDRATILEQENLGFAAGVNAADAATPPYVNLVLLNPDAQFAPGGLEALVEHAIAKGCDIVSPRIIDKDNRLIWFDGGSVHRLTGEVRHDRYGATPDDETSYLRTLFVSGCALMLSPRARSLLLPMNERLFMYYEDVELSARAEQLGLQMFVDRGSIVIHDEGTTSRQAEQTRSPLFYYYQARNRLIADIGVSRTTRYALTPFVLSRATLRILLKERPPLLLLRALYGGTVAGMLGKAGRP